MTKARDELGDLIESFVNRVSHPRGLALKVLANASVTTPQVILLDFVQRAPASTPSRLAKSMRITASSVSQMIDRLVKLRLLARVEDPRDRRNKTISITPKAATFLARLQTVRAAEYAAGVASLSDTTRKKLAATLVQVIEELS